MAKFVGKAKARAHSVEDRNVEEHPAATVNYEGGLAFQMTPEMELYQRTASCLMNEPHFYGETGEAEGEIYRLVALVAKINPKFVLQLAVHCRNDLYLRSVSLALLVEACKYPETRQFVRAYGLDVIKRADELAETLACYIARNGQIGDGAGHRVKPNIAGDDRKPQRKAQPKVVAMGKMSNPLKRVLAAGIRKFNAHQLAKYDRDGDVRLRDVVMIAHPKPRNDEERTLYKQILERTLPKPDTWEVKSSETKGGLNAVQWQEMQPKLGFMAMLRNLRNMLDAGADMSLVVKRLEDRDEVKRSKQFPYRFLSAYKVLQGHKNIKASRVLDGLQTSMEHSIENVPEWPGVTYVSTDHSSSMSARVSEKSQITNQEIGDVLGALAVKLSHEAIVSAFGDTHALVHLSQSDGILTNVEKIHRLSVGHSTNAWLAVQYLREHKVKVDRICIFSDGQCYDSVSPSAVPALGYNEGKFGWHQRGRESLAGQVQAYRKEINPAAFVYSFNLQPYGSSQFPQDDPRTCLLSGWSEKVLQFIPMFEQRQNALGNIMKIEPGQFQKKPREPSREPEPETDADNSAEVGG